MGAGADATATYAIALEDETSGAAQSAAQALEELRQQIKGDTAELAAMKRAMKQLQGGTSVSIQQFRDLKERIDAKSASLAVAQSSFVALGGEYTKAARGGKAVSQSMALLQKLAAGLHPRLGALVGRLRNFAEGLSFARIGMIALVGGLGLFVIGTGVAVAALVRYGFAQSDARRSELLRLQGLASLGKGYGTAIAGGAAMQASIDQVSASSALGRDKVGKLAEELAGLGLRGENLTSALEGAAVAAVVQGDKQASAFGRTAAGAARAGKSVAALAQGIKNKIGGLATAQMYSLAVQAEKQKENFDALFSGLQVDKALKGLFGIRNLLSQNTASGRALKAMLSSVLQPFIDAFEAAAPVAKRFFQGVIIQALRMGIGFLKVRNAIKSLVPKSVLEDLDLAKTALWAGQIAAGLFATALLAVALPALLVGTAIWSVINTSRLLYQMWKETPWSDLGKEVFGWIAESAKDVWRTVTGFAKSIGPAAMGLGRSIVQGIADGITGGAKWVIDSLKNLASLAGRAFRESLGIASPSKAFARMGLAIPQGAALGVKAGAPEVNVAVSRMFRLGDARDDARRAGGDLTGGAPSIPAAAPSETRGAAARARGAAQGPTVQIGEVHLHTTSERPRELAQDFRRELERVLEGVAIQMGAPQGAT